MQITMGKDLFFPSSIDQNSPGSWLATPMESGMLKENRHRETRLRIQFFTHELGNLSLCMW